MSTAGSADVAISGILPRLPWVQASETIRKGNKFRILLVRTEPNDLRRKEFLNVLRSIAKEVGIVILKITIPKTLARISEWDYEIYYLGSLRKMKKVKGGNRNEIFARRKSNV